MSAEISETPTSAARPLDPIDAMLRGRNARPPFWQWLKTNVASIYPK